MRTELALVAVERPVGRERTDVGREVFVNTFFEVLAEVERAYSDEIAQEPKPHREKLRVELAASVQTMQTVLNLSGLRTADRFVVSSTPA